MNSKEIKAKLMHHYRFINSFKIIGTEVNLGHSVADFIACNLEKTIEIEVKINWSNYLKDYSKKKHKRYIKGISYNYIPNQFYFAAPEELALRIKDDIIQKEDYKKYGVILVSDLKIPKRYNKRIRYCKVIKRAGIIQKKYCKNTEYSTLLRMGSQLTTQLLMENNYHA